MTPRTSTDFYQVVNTSRLHRDAVRMYIPGREEETRCVLGGLSPNSPTRNIMYRTAMLYILLVLLLL